MMNNPMQMFMNMLTGGNVNGIMSMFGNNPLFKQAQNMVNSTNDPKKILYNIAKQKGLSDEELKKIANSFNIKL